MNFSKPGELIKASRDKRMKRSVMTHLKKKGFKVGTVKHSGSFGGKSNALGQGGRAAQLKARGVPGGIIGNMARAAHAAPGQANFHKKSKHMKRKASGLNGSEMMAMKKAKKRKHSAMAVKGLEEFAKEEGKEKKSKHMKRKSAVCMKCKAAHAEHEKHSEKRAKKA